MTRHPEALQDFADDALFADTRKSKGVLYTIRTEIERQKGRFFLWLPFLFSIGIGAYFLLSLEPPFWPGLFCFGFALMCLLLFRESRALWYFSMIGLVIAAGFVCAQIRTHLIYTAVIKKEIGPVIVEGNIAALETLEGSDGSRLVLSHLEIEDLAPEQTPRKIRLTLRKDENLFPGQRVRVLARLHPPSPPSMPGGFDFQRYMYFHGIGAVGFIYRMEEILKSASAAQVVVERMRFSIGRRIANAMPSREGEIAKALVVGQRSGILSEDQEALRESGLAHLLAISGLHVGLFSAAIFFAARLFMALIPNLALKHPIKKYAALIALAGALFYTILAGATIPTQRALLMTGLIFIAILFDRSPISLRLVAFAALVILAIFPESLLSASFHMSFAAVAALVLFYEWLRPYWSAWHRQAGILRRIALYIFSLSATSILAAGATAPFALYHFQQIAVLGVLANLAAVPLMGFMIMPSAVLGLFFMPVGLEGLPLFFMQEGIGWVLDVAHWVSSLPGAVLKLPAWSWAALVLMVVGAYILFLWKGYLRFTGIALWVFSVILIGRFQLPAVLVADNFDLVAFYQGEDGLYISNKRRHKFIRHGWERAYGLEEDASILWPAEGKAGDLNCGGQGYRLNRNGLKISYLISARHVVQECGWADLIIVPEPVRAKSCESAQIIDLFTVLDHGAHGIYIDHGLRIEAVGSNQGKRLWNSDLQPLFKSAEAESFLLK